MLTIAIIIGLVSLVVGVLASIVGIVMMLARPRSTIVIWYDEDDLN